MEVPQLIFVFIFGTIIGSFLNVVILRYNTGANFGGRSRCFSCGKEIRWYDLVPVLSFVFLRGTCRFCKSKLSFQYPAVEFLTGALFLATFLKYGSEGALSAMVLDMAVIAVLIVIGVYDLRHKIIPDSLVFLFSILALGRIISMTSISSLLHFSQNFDLVAGPILAMPIFILWLVSKGRWIGLGDAKLALGIGWFLGLSLGLSSMVIGFWIGAIVGLGLIAFSKFARIPAGRKVLLSIGIKRFGMKSEIPLAPFLIAGLLIVYFFGTDVIGLNMLFAF